MRTLAILMTSISLITTALFAHALVAADEAPAPRVTHVSSP
jgi:hypothetical protein